MDVKNTARIEIVPEGGDLPHTKTERIVPPGRPDGEKTICLAPDVGDKLVEPKNDGLFDQYTIYSKIGSGGMGVVYLARDKRLGRFVAIKRLNHQAQSNPSLRQRFLHEARAVATLSHVHIVHIYSLGEDNDGPFIVMEYVAGPDDTIVRKETESGGLVNPNPPLTLDQYVTRHGSLSENEALDVLLKIGRAVAYAHTCGVIHRDLKPSNILLDKSNEPKIVDFGLARLMRTDESKLTVPGEKLLSLGYGAPEQESDASHTDERSDVYGLGALLYFTLTGQNPRYFREQDVPVSLREVVIKALATDKDQRWSSANEFVEALHRVQSKTRVETPTVKTTWRCKWCDAINPLSTKYCAECGWDGSEACPECGADTFVGIQYCGTCGADARAYESVRLLLKKMQDAMERLQFERVISYAGRVHGFEPAGPSGRRYLQDIATLRDMAEKNIRRREQLKEQIPIEMRAENYERAKTFIRQYRELSEDKLVFSGDETRIPDLMLQRDLLRARRALKNREWGSASRICDDLLKTVAPDNAEVLSIRRAIRVHASFKNIFWVSSCFLIVLALYFLSLPLIPYLDKPPFERVILAAYRPAYALYRVEEEKASSLFHKYAEKLLPNGVSLDKCFEESKSFSPPPERKTVQMPEGATQKQAEYARQLQEIAVEQSTFLRAWPLEYLRELERLMEQRRTAGDFEGWAIVQEEHKRFDESRVLPVASDNAGESASELTLLQTKYRQILADQRLLRSRKIVTLCKKYVNELTDMQRALMKGGKMDQALAVNEEIRRARSEPKQMEAEELLVSASSATGRDVDATPQVLFPATVDQRVQGMSKMRETFEKSLVEISRIASKRAEEWPESYLGKLNDLMENFQRAGDYSGWESVREEINRFEADRALSPRNIAQLTPDLAVLQRRYLDFQDTIKRTRAEKVLDTTEKYVRDLQELQKKLTVAGRMDTASVVNAEIRRVRTRVDFLEAQNELHPAGPPIPPSLKLPNTEAVSTNVPATK